MTAFFGNISGESIILSYKLNKLFLKSMIICNSWFTNFHTHLVFIKSNTFVTSCKIIEISIKQSLYIIDMYYSLLIKL